MSDDPRWEEDSDDGCLCQRCTRRYRVDFNIPDALWKKIHRRYNLLCGFCIVHLIEARGQFDYFDVVKLDE